MLSQSARLAPVRNALRRARYIHAFRRARYRPVQQPQHSVLGLPKMYRIFISVVVLLASAGTSGVLGSKLRSLTAAMTTLSKASFSLGLAGSGGGVNVDSVVQLADTVSTPEYTFVPPIVGAAAEFIPPEVGADIWVGSVIATLPFIYATVIFKGRIDFQRNCLVCTGSGLVYATKTGTPLKNPRKCWSCGGLLPWLGWKYFWLSNLDIGNGGVLLQPDKDYAKTNERIRKEREQALEPDSGSGSAIAADKIDTGEES
jgi:hypothetical protein